MQIVFVVASNFSSFNESVKFFTTVHQVTPSVSSFSECMELFSDFGHISVDPSDVIPLAIRNPFIFFVLSLGVLPSELLHCICLKCMMRPINR